MKVKDLIEILSREDPEKTIVVVDEFEQIGLPLFSGVDNDSENVYILFDK